MKKVLAILLVAIMVLPMALSVSAEESVTDMPFYCINVGGGGEEIFGDLKYTFHTPYFWTGELKDGQEPYAYYDGGTESRAIPDIAAALKKTFDNQPAGTRYINFVMPRSILVPQSEAVVYMEKPAAAMKEWVSAFAKEYQRIGGKIDGFALDLEYENIWAYYLHARVYSVDKDIYKKIVSHPQYETVLRPRLVERGFKFYEDASEETTELWGITGKAGKGYEDCQSVWDVVVKNMCAEVLTESVYEPLKEYFPDINVSDYQTKSTYNWVKTVTDYGNNGIDVGGNLIAAGNSSNFNTYSYRPTLAFYQNTQTNEPTYDIPVGFIGGIYENTPYNMFLWDMHIFKEMYEMSGDYGVSMWIGGYNRNKDNPNSVSNTPYYTETLLHMGLLNPEPFLGYLVTGDFENDMDDYKLGLTIVDDIMAELTRVVGKSDRKALYVPTTWNDSYVLSGMYAGGKNYWRITPDTTQVTLKNFKVEGNDPTFTVNGKTITFPQGKIIEDGKVRVVGTCGYWIETPADVTPVITVADNYFSKYPAFSENYQQYKVGTEYTYENIKPIASWEFKKSAKSSAVIQDNGGSNALALTGTYTLKNVNVPEDIMAGDTYAEHQAWQVTVTVPANMADDAEVVVLNCVGQKSKSDDLGVKIAGGKLYYDKAGEYQELEGIDLSAGGTVTIRREVDFTDAKALKCHYTVVDPTGKVLGKVQDVPMVELSLPITTICIGVSKVTGDPVLFDNYKLYITGVAADFELYDANTGLFLNEIDKAREADTAYRVSWVNATRSEKVYSVVAAYYEGDKLVSETVVEEIKMAPGVDGIDTAIVKNEEGKSLLVYLRDDSPAEGDGNKEPSAPGNKPGNPTTNPAGDDQLLIVVIVLAVLTVASLVALVVVILNPGKKKTPKAVKKVEEPEAVEADKKDASDDTAE